jgi:hypothetical protein
MHCCANAINMPFLFATNIAPAEILVLANDRGDLAARYFP